MSHHSPEVSATHPEIEPRVRSLTRRRLVEAFDHAAVGMALVGHDQRFIDVNQRLCEMLGYSKEQLQALSFLQLTHPEDLQPTREQFALLLEARTPHYAIEKRYLRSDGQALWVRVTVTALRTGDGEIECFVGVIDDISQRRSMEEALRDARARLEVTLNAAEIGTWTWDLLADCISADRNLARIFGITPERAAAGRLQDYIDAISTEDHAAVQAAVDRALHQADGRYEVDFRVRQADGSLRWVAARGQVLRDAAGRAVQLPGVAMDISARKRAEETMRDTTQRLQLVLAASNLGDWLWDARTDLMTLSARAAEIYGVPPGVPISRTAMRQRLRPEDGARALAAADEAVRTGNDYVIEYQVVQPNGQRCWVAVRGRNLRGADGMVRGMIGVVQDATERHQAEAMRSHLAAVVESSDDAIVTKTLDGQIASWNSGAQRMFGYPAEEVIGQPVSMLFPEDLLMEEVDILARLRRGERIEHYETVRRRKDGSLLNVSLTVSPIRDVHGVIVGASKIARDITHQKRLNAALRETDRRKDEFLATLAHELRNPLAPIRQAALISSDPAATEQQKRWSQEVINRQVQHMALLLDDLLDISRITRGTLELRTEPTELAAIVDAAVETARPSIVARHHEFGVSLPAQPVHLVADPLRLAQVLSNLLTNAAKYTDPHGRIDLLATSSNGELSLRVRDNGIGIATEAQQGVFTMFSQVVSSRDRSEGGLGIGLALSKGLVELHGGRIEAHSAGVGLGSEFVVFLPLQSATPRSTPQEAPPTPRDGATRRILVADDNRDAADSLAMLLRLDGHEVTVVHDGAAALRMLREQAPEVALLDIGMPGLSGYEIARAVRSEMKPVAPVLVAVTGWGQASDKAAALAAGFDHHFTKPLDPQRLAQVLRLPPAGPRSVT